MATFINFFLLLVAVVALFKLWRWKYAAPEQKELEFIFFADENRQLEAPEAHKERK